MVQGMVESDAVGRLPVPHQQLTVKPSGGGYFFLPFPFFLFFLLFFPLPL